jgi:iron complex transport system ATP-binding protein
MPANDGPAGGGLAPATGTLDGGGFAGAVTGSDDATEVAVRLTGITAGYRGRQVLAGVTLEIAAGERLVLVGPNGAGKSTLLRVLTGVVAPTSGSVRLGGDPVPTLDRRTIARRVAVVPGEASLPFSTRVSGVVSLGRLPYLDPLRGPTADDHAAVDAALEVTGIAHLRDRDARELSLGERQLVLVAMAVAQQTPILVLDEPTVHLDLAHQVAMMELLADLNRRHGTTIIAVLHDIALAAHAFPRMVVLDHGRVVADGPPPTVLDGTTLRRTFGVEPGLFASIAGTLAGGTLAGGTP